MSSGFNSKKGAGVILSSPLVHNGWKLPNVMVSEADDKYLFDLEVKINVGHYDCEFLVWDALVDFPPELLLQRAGFLQAMLNVVGSVITHRNAESEISSLSPVRAVEWFTELFEKLTESFQTLLKGDMCSLIPPHLMHGMESTNDNENFLASKVASAMFRMKYPLISTQAAGMDHSGRSESTHQYGMDDAIAVSPPPSVAGIAFAIIAAALPLLQAQEVQLSTAVLTLVKTVLPFIMEPSLTSPDDGGSDTHGHSSIAGDTLSTADLVIGGASGPTDTGENLIDRASDAHTLSHGRLQHLLNRVDQLVSVLDIGESPLREMKDVDKRDNIATTAFDVSFLHTVLEVLSMCPPAWIQSHRVDYTTAEVGQEKKKKLVIGKQTAAYLRVVLVDTCGGESVLDAHRQYLFTVLEKIDSDTERDIKTCLELRHAATSMQELQSEDYLQVCDLNVMTDDSQRHALGVLRSAELCTRMIHPSLGSCEGILSTVKATALTEVLPTLMAYLCYRSHYSTEADADVHSSLNAAVETCSSSVAHILMQADNPTKYSLICSIMGIICAKSQGSLLMLIDNMFAAKAYWSCFVTGSSVPSADEIEEMHTQKQKLIENCQLSRMQLAMLQRLGIESVYTDPAIAYFILKELSSPSFVWILIETILLLEGSDAESSTDLHQILLCLLEIIAGNVMRLDLLRSTSIEMWAGLLGQLKMLEWSSSRYATDLPDNRSTGTTSLRDMPRGHLAIFTSRLSELRALTARIEDLCVASTKSCIVGAYNQTLCLGLYHTNPLVRGVCAAGMKMSLYAGRMEGQGASRAYSAATNWGGGEGASMMPVEVMESVLQFDPFSMAAKSRLSDAFREAQKAYADMKSSHNDLASAAAESRVKSFQSTYTHSDVWKLEGIAFGSSDFKVKEAAVGQIIEVLSDQHLITTIDSKRALRLAYSAGHTLERSSLARVSYTDVDDEEIGYLAQLIRLIYRLVVAIPPVRQAITFSLFEVDSKANSDATLSNDLKTPETYSKISAEFLVKTTLSMHMSSDHTAIQELKMQTAQLLFSVLIDEQRWCLHDNFDDASARLLADRGDTFSVIPLKRNLVMQNKSVIDEAVVSPSMKLILVSNRIIHHYLYPCSVASTSMASRKYVNVSRESDLILVNEDIAFISAISSFQDQEGCMPAVNMLDTVLQKTCAVYSNATLDAAAAHVVSALCSAASHSAYRHILTSACALCLAVPALQFEKNLLCADILKPLKKILNACPNTENDYITLTHTLKLLAPLANAVKRTIDEDGDRKMPPQFRDFFVAVFDSIYDTLSPLFSFAPPGATNVPRMNDKVPMRDLESSTAYEYRAVQRHLLRQVSIVTSTSLSTRSLFALGKDDGSITRKMAIICGVEIAPSSVRSAAGEALVILLRKHNAASSLTADAEADQMIDAADIEIDVDPINQLIRTAQHLRSPDSLRSSGALIACLKVLASYYQTIDERTDAVQKLRSLRGSDEWKWLIRLCYDRRSEVKALALEICRSMYVSGLCDFGMSAFIDGASESGDETQAAVHGTLNHFQQVAMDASESALVRSTAAAILLHTYRRAFDEAGRRAGWSYRETNDSAEYRRLVAEVGSVMTTVTELFEATSITCSVRVLSSLTQQLVDIWGSESVFGKLVLTLSVKMKVLPRLVGFLHAESIKKLSASAISRLRIFTDESRVDGNAFISQTGALVNAYFDADGAACAPAVSLYGRLRGWNSLVAAAIFEDQNMLFALQGTIARGLLLLAQHSADGSFDLCLKHTNMIRNLLECIASPLNPKHLHVASASLSLRAEHAELTYQTNTMQSDLLSCIISRDMQIKVTGNKQSVGSLVVESPVIPLSVLRALCINVEDATTELSLRLAGDYLTSDSSVQVECFPKWAGYLLTSQLRLLALMLADERWRRGLGLGGTAIDGTLGVLAKRLVGSLLKLRWVIDDLEKHVEEPIQAAARVGLQIDVALAAVMRHSFPARQLILSTEDTKDEDDIATAGAHAFQECIKTIQTTVNDHQAGEAVLVPPEKDEKSLLTSLKKRHSQFKEGTNDSNATLSDASKARQLRTNRWRNKTRGYTVADSVALMPSDSKLGKKAALGGGTPSSGSRVGTGRLKTPKSKSPVTTASSHSPPNGKSTSRKAKDEQDSKRLKLFRALVFLQNALAASMRAQELAVRFDLQTALSAMLSATSIWLTNATNRNPDTADDDDDDNEGNAKAVIICAKDHTRWVPTYSEIAAAIISTWAAFSYCCPLSKMCLSSAGETRIALSEHRREQMAGVQAGGQGSSIHQLLSLGLSSGVVSDCRWLLLGLLRGMLVAPEDFRCISSAQRVVLGSQLNSAVQKSMHARTADPDATVHLMDTLAACAERDPDANANPSKRSSGLPGGGTKSSTKGLDKSNTTSVSSTAIPVASMTIPGLLEWIWDAQGLSHRKEISASAVRYAGRVAACAMSFVDDDDDPTNVVKSIASVSGVDRRMLANVTCEPVLKLLVEASDGSQPEAVQLAALAGLRVVLFASEQARSVVKTLLLQHEQSVPMGKHHVLLDSVRQEGEFACTATTETDTVLRSKRDRDNIIEAVTALLR